MAGTTAAEGRERATIVAQELEALYRTHGHISRQLVLDEARRSDSPLHSHFTWDDTTAAEKHRLAEAGALIRSVKVKFVAGEPSAPEQRRVNKYVALPGDTTGSNYLPVDEVVQDPMLLKLLLAQMRRDWQTLVNRYAHYEEFAELVRTGLIALKNGASPEV